MLNPTTILVLAPHTDDGELGAGASIARWTAEGKRVVYVAFSTCQDSVPGGWPSDVLEHEVRAATGLLGIAPPNLIILDYKVRRFSDRRQDILDDLIRLRKEFAPDVILAPTRDDLHQDHAVVHMEAIRAFKASTILSYELAWNNISFTTSFFSIINEKYARKKIDALDCYASQRHRDYFNAEFLLAQLRFRGVQVGAQYAEAFEVVRVVAQ